MFSRIKTPTDSISPPPQVTPNLSLRLPGLAQQRRALSIHEYLSADLLSKVSVPQPLIPSRR